MQHYERSSACFHRILCYHEYSQLGHETIQHVRTSTERRQTLEYLIQRFFIDTFCFARLTTSAAVHTDYLFDPTHDFVAALGSFCGRCVIILWPPCDHLAVALGLICGRFKIILWSLWDHFVIALGSTGDRFGIILWSLWDHFVVAL